MLLTHCLKVRICLLISRLKGQLRTLNGQRCTAVEYCGDVVDSVLGADAKTRPLTAPSNRARCGLTRSRSATLEPTKSGPTGETADETVQRQVMPTSSGR